MSPPVRAPTRPRHGETRTLHIPSLPLVTHSPTALQLASSLISARVTVSRQPSRTTTLHHRMSPQYVRWQPWHLGCAPKQTIILAARSLATAPSGTSLLAGLTATATELPRLSRRLSLPGHQPSWRPRSKSRPQSLDLPTPSPVEQPLATAARTHTARSLPPSLICRRGPLAFGSLRVLSPPSCYMC